LMNVPDWYQYGDNSPVVRVDPSGMAPERQQEAKSVKDQCNAATDPKYRGKKNPSFPCAATLEVQKAIQQLENQGHGKCSAVGTSRNVECDLRFGRFKHHVYTPPTPGTKLYDQYTKCLQEHTEFECLEKYHSKDVVQISKLWDLKLTGECLIRCVLCGVKTDQYFDASFDIYFTEGGDSIGGVSGPADSD
ncbi:MAG: hypothetical protein ACRDHZ_22125, partial [Ktedonobacteraceae bacterium]